MPQDLLRDEVQQLTLRCRLAQREWAQRPIGQRLSLLRNLRSALLTERENLTSAVIRDISKPAAETLAAEILALGAACKFAQKRAAKILKPRKISRWDRPLWLMGQSDWVHRRPRGIVGIIGTWNYPLFLNGVQIIQALAAGNAVIWKPSEVAPHSADALWAWLQHADWPEGLLSRLPATREGGPALADADIDHVIFTGHVNTGRKLAEHLGRRLISSTLELSGCDASFVLDDADAAFAAKAAWFGATTNRGQTCIAVRRAFVDRQVYPQFVEALKPLCHTAPSAELALPAQAEHARQLIREAVEQGAKQLPNAPEGARFAPTALIDVSTDMAICRQDSFAPILSVIPFERLEDAVASSRECAFHLGASVFTSHVHRAYALADQLQAGMVTVNDLVAPTAHPATPFGGVKHSGWGATQGAEGLLEMTVPQVVSVRRGKWRPHYDAPGATRMTSEKTLTALMQWTHGATWWQRLKGFFRLLK